MAGWSKQSATNVPAEMLASELMRLTPFLILIFLKKKDSNHTRVTWTRLDREESMEITPIVFGTTPTTTIRHHTDHREGGRYLYYTRKKEIGNITSCIARQESDLDLTRLFVQLRWTIMLLLLLL